MWSFTTLTSMGERGDYMLANRREKIVCASLWEKDSPHPSSYLHGRRKCGKDLLRSSDL